jgi:cellulose biosynthesis protein BcsQ
LSQGSVKDYFFGKYTLPEIIRPTNFSRLWVLPSAHNANLAAKGVHEWPQRAITFAKDLHAMAVAPPPYHGEKFDWIILDTPTADEYRIRLALAAAHFVVAPAIPSYFASSGLQILLASVDTMQGLMGQYVDLMGCFLTQCNGVNNRTKELLGDTLDALKIRNVQLFETTIPRSPSIETAHLKQKSLFGRSVLSAVARAYDDLVEKEIKSYVSNYSAS